MDKNSQNEMSSQEGVSNGIRENIDKHFKSRKKFVPRKKRKGFILKIILVLFVFGGILGIGFFVYDLVGKNIVFNTNQEKKQESESSKNSEIVANISEKEDKKDENKDIYENQDEDGDGLSTVQEMGLGTKSEEDDSDIDGLPDGWEVVYELDPLEYNDALSDDDEDKLTNIEEYKYKTDPQNPDTDNDGYEDGSEVSSGYNPNGRGRIDSK